MRRPTKTSEAPWRYTGGAILADGTVLDLVRDEKDGMARILACDAAGRVSFPTCVGSEGCSLWAMEEPECWVRKVRLPATANLDAETSIFDRVADLFSPWGPEVADVLAAAAISTWFCDRLQAPLRLFVYGTGAESVLRRLAAVTRRGVLLQADMIGNYPELLQPTLILSVTSPRLAKKFLRPSSGAQLQWKGGRIVDDCVSRIAGYPDESKPIKGVLNIMAEASCEPSEGNLDELQADLLGYRLRTLHHFEEDSGIPDAILRTLLSGFLGEEEISARIVSSYEAVCGPLKTEMMRDEDAAVIEVLADLASRKLASAYVADIANEAERRLASSGSYLSLSPRGTGEVLRRLGITTERLSASGRGVRLDSGNRAAIERLSSRAAVNDMELTSDSFSSPKDVSLD